jgi:thiol-disulfide isomerase/thioredoxin
MSKFGELINAQVPVLIDFYTEWNESSVSMHPVIRDVAAALGDSAKVIKIDVDKNQELADALRIKGLPKKDKWFGDNRENLMPTPSLIWFRNRYNYI